MAIKLVMSDIDGTLINGDHAISKRTQEAVQALVAQGIQFGVATGRNFDSAKNIVVQTGIDADDAPIVALNGIHVEHKSIDYVEYGATLNYEACRNLAELGERYYMGVLYFFEDNVYFHMDDLSLQDFELNRDEDFMRFFKESMHMDRIDSIDDIKYRFDNNERILKVVYLQNPSYSELVQERIALEMPKELVLMMVGPGWAEIMPKSVNKGDAILKYAKTRGIKPEEILTFGDSDNDLTMIQKAGTGVAVANARSSVKILADDMTDTNLADGVAKYIEKHLLKWSID